MALSALRQCARRGISTQILEATGPISIAAAAVGRLARSSAIPNAEYRISHDSNVLLRREQRDGNIFYSLLLASNARAAMSEIVFVDVASVGQQLCAGLFESPLLTAV